MAGVRGGSGGRGRRAGEWAAREALALFRGDPLADVADEPFAGAEIRRLEELRLTAAELAIDADLAAGPRSAARVKFASSTTATKYSSCRKSITVHSSFDSKHLLDF